METKEQLQQRLTRCLRKGQVIALVLAVIFGVLALIGPGWLASGSTSACIWALIQEWRLYTLPTWSVDQMRDWLE